MSQPSSVNTPLIMLNGVVGSDVSALDRGLAFGDGLFETMRLHNGKIPLLNRHLARLDQSCQRLQLPLDLTSLKRELTHFIAEILRRGTPAGAIKLIYTRGQGGRGYYPPLPDATKPTTLLIFHCFEHQAPQPVTLQLLNHRLAHNPYLAGMKHLNRLEYVMAAQSIQWDAVGVEQQGLLLDIDDNIVETLHHNLFVIRRQQLLTPVLAKAGVRGVLRELIIEKLAAQTSLSVMEKPIKFDELKQADEVFICNSLRGVQPVARVQSQNWHQWPLTAVLQQRLHEFWDADEHH